MDMDVMWSSLRWPGTEHVRWTRNGHLRADSLGVYGLSGGPARVSYQLLAEPGGGARRVAIEVTGPTGSDRLVLAGDGAGSWFNAEGEPITALAGCLDVDISITPLTNTLPIRRLCLEPGANAELSVVYVTVPDLRVRAVTQRYTRLDHAGSAPVYRYRSGAFHADITVDEHGLVLDYPGIWKRSTIQHRT